MCCVVTLVLPMHAHLMIRVFGKADHWFGDFNYFDSIIVSQTRHSE